VRSNETRFRWLVFAAVTFGYLSVTVGEALLSPAFPLLARRLGLEIGTAGVAAGVLNVSIAVGAILGGFFLSRYGSQKGVLLGLSLSAGGGFLTAASGTLDVLLIGQAIGGFGSGMFFASGLSAIGVIGGTARRGLAIAVFSVAFTAGVALAPTLVALAGADHWRIPFAIAASFSVAAAVSISIWRIRTTVPTVDRMKAPRSHLKLLRVPLVVGGVAAISQYGTVFFLPLFAVTAWGLSPASAALLLVVARILSLPVKLLAGNASDSGGALSVAKRYAAIATLLGIWWTFAPGPELASWAAVLYVPILSTLGPLSNVLAYDQFGDQGSMLGIVRAGQIGLGAATASAIGLGAAHFGLRPVLTTAVVLPAVVLLLSPDSARSEPQTAENVVAH
jgi:predicted MFS family arabinose efflux permease